MLSFLVLVGIALIVYLLFAPVFLFLRVQRLTRKLEAVEAQLRGALPAEDVEDAPVAEEPEAPLVEEEAPAASVAPQAEDGEAAPEAAVASPWDVVTQATEADEAPAPVAKGRSVEETLASRWMIWLGGLAVALSAVFLFTYAVDQGWLTPMTRVILGLCLGGALLAAGEWTLRHPVAALARAVRTDFVPPALSAAGIFAVFAALFAAHALFGLLTPATAFVALGLTAYSALGLALRQGWFVALLGLAAGYGTPALIEAPDAQPLPLFLYLFVLTAGCLALMVWRRWWWFSALTLAGALVWPVLWMLENWRASDQGVLSAYALGLAALFGGLSARLPVKERGVAALRWLWGLVQESAGLGFALSGGLLILLAEAADYNAAAALMPAGYAAIAVALALWRPRLEGLLPLAAMIGLANLLLWPEPLAVSPPEDVERLGTGSYATAFGPYVMPPEFAGYARGLWALAAVMGLGGFAGLWRGRTVGVWTGVSGAVPVLVFALAYARIGRFEIDLQWATLAVALAVAFVVAASVAGRKLDGRPRDVALSLYAAAATAALALAFACQVREAWLTVAIAAEVLALAWIWSQLRVGLLRGVAVAVLAVVVIRLVFNPLVADYEGSVLRVFGWVVYGYGLPAALIWAASVLFRRGGRDWAVILCEIAGAGLGFAMVALQLRLWMAGDLAAPYLGLMDQAVQTLWWLIAAALLLHARTIERHGWAQLIGLLVLAAAVAQVVLGHVLAMNPLGTADRVGTVPVVSVLGLAYLAPAFLFLMFGLLPQLRLPDLARRLLLAGAGGLVFVYLTLETRRVFQGPVITLRHDTQPGNGELYAYSAVWILYALAILAAGIRWRSVSLRYASMAVLILTVAKVFLYDMSDLTGLFRVASFLGLGLTLIGIGRVYQKYVFAPRETET